MFPTTYCNQLSAGHALNKATPTKTATMTTTTFFGMGANWTHWIFLFYAADMCHTVDYTIHLRLQLQTKVHVCILLFVLL